MIASLMIGIIATLSDAAFSVAMFVLDSIIGSIRWYWLNCMCQFTDVGRTELRVDFDYSDAILTILNSTPNQLQGKEGLNLNDVSKRIG